MPGLRMERAALAAVGRSEATRRAYAADWGDFCAWCALAGRAAAPASADTVSLYLVHCSRRGLALATIERRCCSIAWYHLSAGHASPCGRGSDAAEVIHGLRRKLGVRSKRAKLAISAAELARMVEAAPAGLAGCRDRALLVLGFAGGFRRSELVALTVDDVRIEAAGVVVVVRRSKTDQEGAGEELGIHRGRRAATCPVRALEAWLAERGVWPGPLFVALQRRRPDRGPCLTRRRMSPASVAAVVKRAVALIGLDPAAYGGHSLRAGCATAAAALGRDSLAIMRRTRHRSAAMVDRYVRHGSLFSVDPLDGAL